MKSDVVIAKDIKTEYREKVIRNFLSSLFGNMNSDSLFICITDCKRNELRKNEDFRNNYFTCNNSGIDKAVSHILQIDTEREIYFRTAVLSEETRKGESAKLFPFVYADLDFKGNKNYPSLEDIFNLFKIVPEPSITIHTGNGYHCYWRFKEPVDFEDHPEIYKKWLYYLKSKINKDIDLNSELAKILRIPGTYNNKKANEQLKVCLTAIGNNKIYDSDRIIELYDNENTSTNIRARVNFVSGKNAVLSPQKKDRNSNPGTKETTAKELSEKEKTTLESSFKKYRKLKDLYSGKWERYGFESQSEADQSLCSMLAKIFKDKEKVEIIFRNSKLYRPKTKRKAYLKRTIDKAFKKMYAPPPLPENNKKTGKYAFKRLHKNNLSVKAISIVETIIELEKERRLPPGHPIFAGYQTYSDRTGINKGTVKKILLEIEKYGVISLKIGKSGIGEKEATEVKRIIPIPKKLKDISEK